MRMRRRTTTTNTRNVGWRWWRREGVPYQLAHQDQHDSHHASQPCVSVSSSFAAATHTCGSHGCVAHGCGSHGCGLHGCGSHGCATHCCASHGCGLHGCGWHGCASHCCGVHLVTGAVGSLTCVPPLVSPLSGASSSTWHDDSARSSTIFSWSFWIRPLTVSSSSSVGTRADALVPSCLAVVVVGKIGVPCTSPSAGVGVVRLAAVGPDAPATASAMKEVTHKRRIVC